MTSTPLLRGLAPAVLGLLVAACAGPTTATAPLQAPPTSHPEVSTSIPVAADGAVAAPSPGTPATGGAAPSRAPTAAPPPDDPDLASAIPAPADVAAPPADALTAPSGLASRVLTPGTGTTHPGPRDTVKVHYTGWTTDGRMFDSSVARGEALSFPLNGVIKGWTEGLQLMVAGEKRRLWIPAALAYGSRPPRPGMPSGALTFDVELLDIQAAPRPPDVPADVSGAPKDARKTRSGLRYKLLKAGTSKQRPTSGSRVTVSYSGWTTDGTLFDSSVTRGRPATFPLTSVIPGWAEGVQLMRVGDSMRLWIPADLAYGDQPTRPGTPGGTLVFDIELLSVE